jgi:hypothetical protein
MIGDFGSIAAARNLDDAATERAIPDDADASEI